MTKFNFIVLNADVVLLFVKNAVWREANADWWYFLETDAGPLYKAREYLNLSCEVSISKKLFEG